LILAPVSRKVFLPSNGGVGKSAPAWAIRDVSRENETKQDAKAGKIAHTMVSLPAQPDVQ